jgi:hypothetical protein
MPTDTLRKLKDIVDGHIKKVLQDYQDLGLMISFEKDRAHLTSAEEKRPGDGEHLLLRSR